MSVAKPVRHGLIWLACAPGPLRASTTTLAEIGQELPEDCPLTVQEKLADPVRRSASIDAASIDAASIVGGPSMGTEASTVVPASAFVESELASCWASESSSVHAPRSEPDRHPKIAMHTATVRSRGLRRALSSQAEAALPTVRTRKAIFSMRTMSLAGSAVRSLCQARLSLVLLFLSRSPFPETRVPYKPRTLCTRQDQAAQIASSHPKHERVDQQNLLVSQRSAASHRGVPVTRSTLRSSR